LSAAKAYAFFLDAQEPFSFAKKKDAALDHSRHVCKAKRLAKNVILEMKKINPLKLRARKISSFDEGNHPWWFREVRRISRYQLGLPL